LHFIPAQLTATVLQPARISGTDVAALILLLIHPAGVGIFGQQAIPTAITVLVFWPVIIAQVWNMAQESNLDEEALRVAEESLKSHSSQAPSEATAE